MISSRTPGGTPNCCPVCGGRVRVEPSLLFGDAPCPLCGSLLWFLRLPAGTRFFDAEEAEVFRDRVADLLAEKLEMSEDEVWTNPAFVEESLDLVELLVELEDEMGFDWGDPATGDKS